MKYLPSFLLFTLLVLTLDTQSLWWDEGISLHLATSSWGEVIADRAANIHPPLYFLALKLWVGLAGQTPFAARYLSVLAATLLPAAAFAFMRRHFGLQTGRAAALLIALAPPFFIYGQETRAYAFLPLLSLALLAQMTDYGLRIYGLRIYGLRIANQRSRDSTPLSAGFALSFVQAVFILTHYAGVIAVGWANIVLLVRLARAGDWRQWRRWALVSGLTALLILPWAGALLAVKAVGLHTEAGIGNILDTSIPWDYLLRLVGSFHLTGLPQSLAISLLTRPITVTVILFFLTTLLYYLLPYSSALLLPRSPASLLPCSPAPPLLRSSAPLFPLFLSLTAIPLLWLLSPQAHPRYLLPFVLGAWLWMSVLITARRLPVCLRAALLGAVLITSVLSLFVYLTDPVVARSDVRSVAVFLRERAQEGDVVLVPHTDWSLAQYDVAPARLVMLPSSTDEAAVAAVLAEVIAPESGTHVIYALDYGRRALDPREQVRVSLTCVGLWRARHKFQGVFLDQYDLYPSTSQLP
ncbi:MAG: glycosyltransferase family 39 protein, partial [Anaerolineae bacterium]|nr:glycosyltransferase family 39 protein [Anaerolineae bacterium]